MSLTGGRRTAIMSATVSQATTKRFSTKKPWAELQRSFSAPAWHACARGCAAGAIREPCVAVSGHRKCGVAVGVTVCESTCC